MKILVINCGSSSIKYKFYSLETEDELASGLIERIGQESAHTIHHIGSLKVEKKDKIDNAEQGLQQILSLLTTKGNPPPISQYSDIQGVGHRVVHGGEDFHESVIINEKVMNTIDKCCELAPLHNPANLAGIKAVEKLLPQIPQTAVFDTAFFQTMPEHAYHYAVPYEWYVEKKVRRYGFHGTSHRYVSMRAEKLINKNQANLITIHMGNGCSMSCIKNGRAIDQSMGLTPLEGLVMGTRSGDFDPAIIFHMHNKGMEFSDIKNSVEKKGGLLGLSGVSMDMRDVQKAAENGNKRANLAINVFVHRAKKYLGAFLAELGQCDSIVFTGGIGENAMLIREKILSGLSPLGIDFDILKNNMVNSGEYCITKDNSKISCWVIPTNEELMIARDTKKLVK